MEAPVNYEVLTTYPGSELANALFWCPTCNVYVKTAKIESTPAGQHFICEVCGNCISTTDCAICGKKAPATSHTITDDLFWAPGVVVTFPVSMQSHNGSLPDAPHTEQTDEDSHTDDEVRALLHRVANRLDHLVAILEKELGR